MGVLDVGLSRVIGSPTGIAGKWLVDTVITLSSERRLLLPLSKFYISFSRKSIPIPGNVGIDKDWFR
jgi:hypothetical protein